MSWGANLGEHPTKGLPLLRDGRQFRGIAHVVGKMDGVDLRHLLEKAAVRLVTGVARVVSMTAKRVLE